jgi:hypothetical protein
MHQKFFLILLVFFVKTTLFAQNGPCSVGVAPTDYANGLTTLTAYDTSAAAVSSYAWSTGGNGPAIMVGMPGEYCVTVTFADGCVATACDTLGNQDCWAAATSSPGNGDTIYLQATNGPAYLQATSYQWSNGATGQQIFVTQPGNYCVTVTAENGCTATSCVNASGNCTLSITQTAGDSLSVGLTANFGLFGPNASYTWSNGASGASASTITVAQPGVYCVTATNQQGCEQSACITVTCGARIQYENGYVIARNILGAAPFTYAWSPVNLTTQAIPTNLSSLYCVTITDATGCTTSICGGCLGTIAPQTDGSLTAVSTLGTPPFGYAWSTGATTANTVPQPDAFNHVTITDGLGCSTVESYYAYSPQTQFMNVWVETNALDVKAEISLIRYDNVPGAFPVERTVVVDAVIGSFYSIPNGEYLVKATLLPNSPTYGVHLPTYFDKKIFWDEAQRFLYNGLHVGGGITLEMVEGQAMSGPGNIGGLVSQGANLQAGPVPESEGPGDPIAGASIVLTLPDGTPVAATQSDSNGAFSFPNLAFGNYVLTIDLPGIPPASRMVSISASQPAHTSTVFTVNSTYIVLSAPEAALLLQGAFPNPFSDQIQVNLREVEGRLLLSNAQGQILRHWRVNDAQMTLPVHDLPTGTYFLTLQTKKHVETIRVVKQ